MTVKLLTILTNTTPDGQGFVGTPASPQSVPTVSVTFDDLDNIDGALTPSSVDVYQTTCTLFSESWYDAYRKFVTFTNPSSWSAMTAQTVAGFSFQEILPPAAT